MKIVFFGTPEFAVASAEAIKAAGHEIDAVVTMPDKPAGRGHKLLQSAVKQWATDNNIKVLQPEKLKDPDFISQLEEIGADIFVVIAFRMLPKIVWDMPRHGTFNLHASLLPNYRGAAPINHALINGEKETGVTTFFLNEEIDTGNIIMREKIAISDEDDAGTLHDRLMELGAKVTVDTLQLIENGNVKTTPQTDIEKDLKTAPKIFHESCLINWAQPAEMVRNFIRGLSPYPAARGLLQFPYNNKEEYKILKVTISDKQGIEPGKIEIDNGHIYVGTEDKAVEILSLQAPGKRALDAKSFLNGMRLKKE